jgi:hypothetical protein
MRRNDRTLQKAGPPGAHFGASGGSCSVSIGSKPMMFGYPVR